MLIIKIHLTLSLLYQGSPSPFPQVRQLRPPKPQQGSEGAPHTGSAEQRPPSPSHLLLFFLHQTVPKCLGKSKTTSPHTVPAQPRWQGLLAAPGASPAAASRLRGGDGQRRRAPS